MMAENKKSFVLYTDQIGIFNKLTDEQAGALIKHIFSYCNDENPVGDFVTDLAFESIKQQLKRDLKKYETRANNSRNNGKLGGRPPKPTKPTGLINNPTKPTKPDTVNVTVNDTVINNIYSLYPTKCEKRKSSTGKSKKDKFKIEKLLKEYSEKELIYISKRYVEETTPNGYLMNYSTFLNNLPDYTEEETKYLKQRTEHQTKGMCKMILNNEGLLKIELAKGYTIEQLKEWGEVC